MIKTYKKQDAPAWQRKLTLFVGALFGATLLLFAAWAVVLFIDKDKVDDCLDNGEIYDPERNECVVDPEE